MLIVRDLHIFSPWLEDARSDLIVAAMALNSNCSACEIWTNELSIARHEHSLTVRPKFSADRKEGSTAAVVTAVAKLSAKALQRPGGYSFRVDVRHLP